MVKSDGIAYRKPYVGIWALRAPKEASKVDSVKPHNLASVGALGGLLRHSRAWEPYGLPSPTVGKQ